MNVLAPSLTLSSSQIAQFRQQGFLTIESITTPEEVAWMRDVFEQLFASRTGWKQGRLYDMVGAEVGGHPTRLPQLSRPSEFAPELRDSLYMANALSLARQLLGPSAMPWFEHSILKPPRHGAATPWHQDEAHRNDPGSDYEQISIWMPLTEATRDNGCMQYVPGSNLGPILTHQSPNSDPRVTALECIGEFDRSAAVACPLPAGGAAIHHCRTLHCAGPNQSDTPRPAYILAFRGEATPNPGQLAYPWNIEKATDAQARAEAWSNRPTVRVSRSIEKLTNRVKGRLRRLFPR